MNQNVELFSEKEDVGNCYREKQWVELKDFIEAQRKASGDKRVQYLKLDYSSV